MRLLSNDFPHKGKMDKKFSYRGKNLSPHLKWEKAPVQTKSFAISCNDPDAPVGDWIHWLICNIPKKINEISRGGPILGTELKNDYGQIGYGGPAPPSGTHRYFFRVYALNIDKLEGINKKNFMEKVKEHTIESAEIIGLYSA
ncbi:MAG: YbhB/YbcL family Raf kinase inhibitor-like protein [Promethearchaeota archaeon]|nr:MAG: YbhB/YbcL family Raf kinase inhibitor-like protein [Candidatus Lokiarchaeota archaeon]